MRCPRLNELPPPPAGRSGWPWSEESPPLPAARPDGTPWPTITVSTPNYNFQDFIEETIRSVLLQGYPELEYIVTDDGSTDGSAEIIRKYEPWLAHWETGENRGQSHAINQGWRRGQGDIFAYLNSDDCLKPGALEVVAGSIKPDEGRHIVFGDCDVIDEKGKKIGYCRGRLPDPGNLLRYWEHDFTIPQPSVFFHRDILQRVGYLDETFHYVMDYDYWVRVSRHYGFYYIPQSLGIMRDHLRAKTSTVIYELLEPEWFRILKKSRGDLSPFTRGKYYLLARNYRSRILRISAYARRRDIPFKKFQKIIFLSLAANPLNIFNPKFASALFRATAGHSLADRVKCILRRD
ncbi:MAG: glycosyltransferase family 2 protein [Candidatus Erginobacter occultus]|nr:glycosyltransferase family 2 protein [Candidatus Erginobacter occultus]